LLGPVPVGTQSRLSQMLVRYLEAFSAIQAQHSDQPLGQHTVKRRNEIIRLDPHIKEAADNVNNIISVDGSEHQVPGQRRLYRDLSGFFVADLADHYLVRVVAQYAPEASRKGQPFLFVHRYLGDSLMLVFDRVLNRYDLVLVVLYLVERAVQCGRLT